MYYMYAGLLKKNFQNQSAATFYGKAAQISIASGNLIKGIISQAHKWRLSRPNREEIESFFSKLNSFEYQNHDFYNFFTSLPLPEKIDLMLNLDIVVIPPKTIVIKPGEIEDSIYIVISGEAKESYYQLLDSKSKSNAMPSRRIREYDSFGKAYPYTEQHKSRSCIETITLMQLARLSRDSLRGLCQKHPRIEQGIIRLFGIRTNAAASTDDIKLRKSNRYPIKVKMNVEILEPSNHVSEYSLSGFSKDLSVTGVGFIPNQSSKELKESLALCIEGNEKRRVNASFYNDNISLSIFGELVRMQEIVESGRKTIVLGIQFEKMPPNMQGFLFSAAKIFSCGY
ncbi:MAG: hypothetical protein HY895_04805 [Deltaproteobacteria bacterium]|nr:hypothetical protein [Deltaproteobacteria bacterium]